MPGQQFQNHDFDRSSAIETRLASLAEQDEAVRHDVADCESEARRGRTELNELEQRISETMEASIQAKTELGRMRELIRVNKDRIQELQSLSERDTKDEEERRRKKAAKKAEQPEERELTQEELLEEAKETEVKNRELKRRSTSNSSRVRSHLRS